MAGRQFRLLNSPSFPLFVEIQLSLQLYFCLKHRWSEVFRVQKNEIFWENIISSEFLGVEFWESAKFCTVSAFCLLFQKYWHKRVVFSYINYTLHSFNRGECNCRFFFFEPFFFFPTKVFLDTQTRLSRGFFYPAAKKTSVFEHTLVVLLKVEKKNKTKKPLGERSACLVFELGVFAKNNFFWAFFFACLGVRARWCSG